MRYKYKHYIFNGLDCVCEIFCNIENVKSVISFEHDNIVSWTCAYSDEDTYFNWYIPALNITISESEIKNYKTNLIFYQDIDSCGIYEEINFI